MGQKTQFFDIFWIFGRFAPGFVKLELKIRTFGGYFEWVRPI